MKKLPWQCKCGAKTDRVNTNADNKCTRCFTFSADHQYNGSYQGGRCATCDTRLESHR